MKTKIINSLCCLLLSLHSAQAQDTLRLYGGYVQINSPLSSNYIGLDVTIYCPVGSTIPDSIHLIGGLGEVGSKSENQILCDNIMRQKYHLEYFNPNPDVTEVKVYFKGVNSTFIGSIDTMIDRKYGVVLSASGGSWLLTQSILFKDYPLINIEKGKTASINLTKEFKLWTGVFPSYDIDPIGPTFNSDVGFLNNSKSGDIFIDTRTLDTGYYTLVISVNEYASSKSYYFLTVHVINKPLPYFNVPQDQKRDSIGIPYLAATKSDSVLNYRVTYINPAGLGQYSVNWESPQIHQKTPQLNTVKINDTTLQINLTIPIDSVGFLISQIEGTAFFWGNELNFVLHGSLLETFSIMVTTSNDSLGFCRNDMTSFYVSRDSFRTTTGGKETKQPQKVNIYPNPSSGSFTVSVGDNRPSRIEVLDIMGNSVIEVNTPNKETDIDLSLTSEGLYFIRVQFEKYHYTSKILIK